MKKLLVIASLICAGALTGCMNEFHGSAPGPDGSFYVVGVHKAPFAPFRPAAWLCPAKAGQTECRWVDVTEQE